MATSERNNNIRVPTIQEIYASMVLKQSDRKRSLRSSRALRYARIPSGMSVRDALKNIQRQIDQLPKKCGYLRRLQPAFHELTAMMLDMSGYCGRPVALLSVRGSLADFLQIVLKINTHKSKYRRRGAASIAFFVRSSNLSLSAFFSFSSKIGISALNGGAW